MNIEEKNKYKSVFKKKLDTFSKSVIRKRTFNFLIMNIWDTIVWALFIQELI